ncbi:MAG: MBL fold metallo-hydrolase [Acidobacteria bacterium]|nr:MAG: MBL fold metallo-hydrolase [Acidobacteriota bacterium]REJ99531.1 MAG: MBL fold metallo-hydrolase [Acidobacteriota bacterium]
MSSSPPTRDAEAQAATGEHTTDSDSRRGVDLQQHFAGPMGNCLYVVGDRSSQQAFLVDPAFEPLELHRKATGAGYDVVGVILTHTHQDHVGGELFGMQIPGVRELLAEHPDLPVHVHEAEARRLVELTGIAEANVRVLIDEQTLRLGELDIRCIHCPGHSPGGVSFLTEGQLIAGDTLFVQGVGRVDLPGSDPDALFYSLRRLIELPPETRVFPGHRTGEDASSTIGREIRLNPYLRPKTVEQWRMMMGVF